MNHLCPGPQSLTAASPYLASPTDPRSRAPPTRTNVLIRGSPNNIH